MSISVDVAIRSGRIPLSRERVARIAERVLRAERVRDADLSITFLSNREIAARLHCSVRTVESHLAQARAKLGAANRAELAHLLPRA